MSETRVKRGDKLVRLFTKYERVFSIAGATWLALSSASYARFITLPDIPFLTDEIALYSSAAYNALWFGFVRPGLYHRRETLNASDKRENHKAN